MKFKFGFENIINKFGLKEHASDIKRVHEKAKEFLNADKKLFPNFTAHDIGHSE